MDWDRYYLSICNTVSENSKCLSRKIGAIIVKDKSIISTGYNGPPRGTAHCGEARWMKDPKLRRALIERGYTMGTTPDKIKSTCPRRLLGYKSGEGLEWCKASHAEANSIINAAKIGISVDGCVMYLNCPIPCKECLKLIINSGISEIVCTKLEYYDYLSEQLLYESGLMVRTYDFRE